MTSVTKGDPYVWPRDSVADKPNQAWCTVCRHRFASGEAFDLHRGVLVRPVAEDARDSGVCAPVTIRTALGLTAIDLIWYTADDRHLKARMDEMRAKR